ncbi:MAG: DUF3263 domain-containing protein [Mycobacterium sp.]
MAVDTLTNEQRAMLDLEAQWFKTAGAKEDAIRAMGLSPVRYYQRLTRLIADEAALACDPVTVNRLRRLSRVNCSATSDQLHSSLTRTRHGGHHGVDTAGSIGSISHDRRQPRRPS